ncbi:MAG: TonB-dependent receptor plug domain-containing protein [Spirosomataceae bacterium]
MKKYILLPLIGLVCVAAQLADDPLVERIMTQLAKYTFYHPQEKVFLHTDKPYYMAGETIWFKAYVLTAFDHQPDTLSRVLYVDLVADQKVLQHKQLKLQDGVAHADFVLPDTLQSASVQLRAYTNWMRNFSDEFFFSQNLRIFKPKETTAYNEERLRQQAEVADFQLFPEGGNQVLGIESRVAFKAVNALGLGVDVSGYILTDTKDTVSAFQSQHLGMGYCSFMPEAGKKYTAIVQQADGKQKIVGVPAALPTGFVMSVDNISNKDAVKVYVFSNTIQAGTAPIPLVLIAQQRGQVCHAVKALMNRKGFLLTIPRTQIPDEGIVQLTLFDNQGQPLCERIMYERKKNHLTVKLNSNKTTYRTREKVQVEVEVKDANGKPVQGSFSLAATDGSQVIAEPYGADIQNYFLLSSDIKGSIEQPGYYFDEANDNATQHLDLLMMTQGWRRFVWNEVLNETTLKPRFYAEVGLSVTGTVLRPNGKTTEKPTNLTLLLSSGENKQFIMGDASPEGVFGFYGLDFSDTTDVLVQAVKTSGGRNLTIRLNDWTTPALRITKVPFNSIEFSRKDLDNFLKRSQEMLEIEQKIKLNKTQLLKEVTIKAKKEEEFDGRKIYSQADNTIKVDPQNCGSAFNVLTLIQGRVAGVQVTGSGFNMSVQIRGAANLQGPVEPLFLMDGMPIDLSMVNTLSPCDVESIDILKGPSAAIFGSRAMGGVISILTRRGGSNYDATKEEAPGIITTKRIGYAVVREFYTPNYDDPKPEERYRPDFRSTLYWKADLRTDEQGKASVTFWNSDAQALINLHVQGFSRQGTLGVGHHSYRVQ